MLEPNNSEFRSSLFSPHEFYPVWVIGFDISPRDYELLFAICFGSYVGAAHKWDAGCPLFQCWGFILAEIFVSRMNPNGMSQVWFLCGF